jgi:dsRNA-specific ribonuclease
MRHVHVPELLKVIYFQELDPGTQSSTLVSLLSQIEDIGIQSKLHNLHLLSAEEIPEFSTSVIAVRQWSISAHRKLKGFSARAEHIQKELGSWASDYYITASIDRAKLSMHVQQNSCLSWKDEEKIHILNTLGKVRIGQSQNLAPLQKPRRNSRKVASLLNLLQNKYNKDFRGIIFVEQRVTAVVLCRLLSEHPETKSLFTCGTFVGTSTNPRKSTDLGDLRDLQEQQNTLQGFREGGKNLIIATSALEEGIDISACNVVVCFNKPPNLKSFIQRRGRARHEKSTFALFSASDDDTDLLADWGKMESEMVGEYMRDSRTVDQERDIVNDGTNNGYRTFRIDSTGYEIHMETAYTANFSSALLTLESALVRLHHFCGTLPAYEYVNSHPVFTFKTEGMPGRIRGFVILPNSVHHSVRQASSLHSWQSERMAAKDAAFEAYVALYKAGLLNDHLLPLLPGGGLGEVDSTEDLSPTVEIQQQSSPWIDIAKKCGIENKRYLNALKVRVARKIVFSTNLILPIQISSLPWSPLILKRGFQYEMCTEDSEETTNADFGNLDLSRAATRLMLRPVCNSSINNYNNSFTVLFAPPIAQDELRAWIRHYTTNTDEVGRELAHNKGVSKNDSPLMCYNHQDVRNSTEWARLQTSHEVEPALRLRDGHLDQHHRAACSRASSVYASVSGETEVTNAIRLRYNPHRFALFAPHIIYRLETLLIAQQLVDKIDRLHPDVHFERMDMVIEAICTPGANGLSSNSRLAFLGDKVLDFLLASQLFATHIYWSEAYLSVKKKLILSNAHLSKMAFQTGLDRFIITKPLGERRWIFPTNSDIHVNDVGGARIASKNTLANVVKALIGAAYLEGQFEKAVQCARAFLPEVTAHPAKSLHCSPVPARHRGDLGGIPHFDLLEKLIGYKFRNAALLVEAMTHPSCEQDLVTGSYGRLAFLGSSVLDMTIIHSLPCEKNNISSNQLQLLLSATINKGFLAFICLDTTLDVDYADIQTCFSQFRKVGRQKNIGLWGFMRHNHPELASERRVFLEKHSETCQCIRQALTSGVAYPWQELAKLEAKGYFSEIVQSLFGAVYTDNDGDMLQCSRLAEKLKILPILQRLMRDNVEIIHPKTRLGELAGDRNVTYLTDTSLANEHHCIVRLDGQQISEARNGSCKEEAIIRAANQAIVTLRSQATNSTTDVLPG